MKRLLTAALGFALLILVSPFDVGAVDGPHTNTCTACHTMSFTPDSSGFNSNCLSCHTSTGEASRKPFAGTDEANTSHKWSGSDTVPVAGAQPPTTRALTQVKSYTGSQLACVNCHNPHLNTPPLGNAKFQRIANDKDQLCLDCHRSRNVQTAAAGSHAVLIGYSAAAKTAPSK